MDTEKKIPHSRDEEINLLFEELYDENRSVKEQIQTLKELERKLKKKDHIFYSICKWILRLGLFFSIMFYNTIVSIAIYLILHFIVKVDWLYFWHVLVFILLLTIHMELYFEIFSPRDDN
jgi:hypothetical protein